MRSFFALFLAVVTQGISSVAMADVGTNAFDPGVALSTNEMNAIGGAASNSLAAFKARITPANRQLMGFSSDPEVAAATNGEPMMVFAMRMNELTNYHAGDDLSLLFEPPMAQRTLRAFIPIMAGTNVRSAMVLRRTAGATATTGAAGVWGGSDWGRPNLIRNLMETWQSIPDTALAPNTVRFVVEVPVPRIWLVGYYDIQRQLILRSTISLKLGAITIHRNQIITPLIMDQLAAEARHYDPALPN